MSCIEYKPSVRDGRNIQSDDSFSCMNMFTQNQQRVIDVGFKNQGTGSIAIIQFSGGEIKLASGRNFDGASWSPLIQAGTFDLTIYKVRFVADGSGAAQVNNVFVGYAYLLNT